MMVTGTFPLPEPTALVLTLAPLRHGLGDPTVRIGGSEAVRASRTPQGPATLHVKLRNLEVEATAWGPGASWAIERVPDLLGAYDDRTALQTDHPLVHDLHRRLSGLRLCRSWNVMEVLIPTILEQKITSGEARRSFRRLVSRYGEPAPGPGGLRLPPAPGCLSALPYWELHPLGIARERAETIRRACRAAPRLEEASAMSPHDAAERLESVPGVGRWTAAHVIGAVLGDPDAVVVGDFHLPRLVGWVLAGEPGADDDRMLELLEEFKGQRARVVRLMAAAGGRPPLTAKRRRIHRIQAH